MTTRSQSGTSLRDAAGLQSLSRVEALQETRRLHRKLDEGGDPDDRRSVGSFLAEASHELGTPLEAIVKLAEILSTEAISDREKRYANLILESANQLKQTLDGVLSLAKLKATDCDLEQEMVNVAVEVESLYLMFEPQAASKGLEYTLTIEDDEGPLCAYIHRGGLSSIVQNLLSNAIKYTDDGSVDVLVRSVSSGPSPSVEIEVSDTGIGMDESFSTRLFDRFEQENPGHNASSNGVGLGLTVAKRFTEAMGGCLDVTTQKGIGSQFRVRFPQIENPTRESEPPAIQSTMTRSQENRVSGREAIRNSGSPSEIGPGAERPRITALQSDNGVTHRVHERMSVHRSHMPSPKTLQRATSQWEQALQTDATRGCSSQG